MDRRMAETALKIFITGRNATCADCREELAPGNWIKPAGEGCVLCLACADLDHLVFLPSGDAALTRRAARYSTLSAVVLKWSKARKRFERKGLLVTTEGLERAEAECLADQDARSRRQERESARRTELDAEYVRSFAARVRELFPHCPPGRELEIAAHACTKYSGRVGRSAAAKSLDANKVRVAVIAHIRHVETGYDELLAQGDDRDSARADVEGDVHRVLEKWRTG